MTSSLVGSEMCIRDSPETLYEEEDVLHASSHGWVGRNEQGEWDLEDPEAVSYTHLTLPTICSV
eukprot:10309650-Prorocentrum_lima.AAC.1